MTDKDKILNFIGIAKRAGKVTTGEDILLSAIKNNKVKFLLVASDTGQSSYKKFMDKSSYYGIPVNNMFLKNELSNAIGMKRTIIGISDNGFAKRLKEMTNNCKGT
ncbi:ribosomal L7Ae/L30e/S12e/Gadd45 family protein [Apilactobacillus apisilvae]|uniref:Ribosomal L7Ae/L30e/S12e/Gadd45 family protein n=1 Tax=Apilactobacillus apisilvae TaxID=2923364 RepID=A0ABY4PHY8_9LACO|nr:ribosomal L7Ae/L30e/S12e/Gadd45 family protein [Apilactobacillus apisilvae]UQS85475.1 ribosomal L7Ae/L30e/S12e/Gadd45 family protein [Apilactobacillus apisilvae]